MTDGELEDLIRIYRLKQEDRRPATDYAREVAKQTADALEELLKERRGIKVEGTVS